MTINYIKINNIELEQTKEEDSPDILTPFDLDNPSKVILFNDDWHTFEEVIMQIMKATSCNLEKAESLTWEVHTKGKTVVYDGSMQECLRVSNILEEISLITQIEF